MRFVPDHRLADALRPRAIAADGACEAGLQLSHWPGNRTPPEYRADLSTEMAFRFSAAPRPGFEVCTNNHHDADGVLSLFALLQPDAARAQQGLLVAAAAFGDFREGEDEDALRLAAVLEGLGSHDASPLASQLAALDEADAGALATERALELLPGLAGTLDKYEPLWAEELGWFQHSRDAARAGELRFTDLDTARLSVVEGASECHPAVASARTKGDLLLHVIEGAEGFHYRADWRYYSWAATVSAARPPIARVDLEKLCLPLNSLETNRRGRWMTHGFQEQGLTEALKFTNPMGEELESHLQPTEVVQKLAWFLLERRPKA